MDDGGRDDVNAGAGEEHDRIVAPVASSTRPTAAAEKRRMELMPPPSPTAEATAPRGMVSETSVYRLAEKPWCAAIAMPISTTATHMLSTCGAR